MKGVSVPQIAYHDSSFPCANVIPTYSLPPSTSATTTTKNQVKENHSSKRLNGLRSLYRLISMHTLLELPFVTKRNGQFIYTLTRESKSEALERGERAKTRDDFTSYKKLRDVSTPRVPHPYNVCAVISTHTFQFQIEQIFFYSFLFICSFCQLPLTKRDPRSFTPNPRALHLLLAGKGNEVFFLVFFFSIIKGVNVAGIYGIHPPRKKMP